MAFQLQDVITAARDRHPAFHRTRITDAVFARFLTDYQNELIAKCVAREPHYLDQSVGIVLNLGGGQPGSVGAGTAGGLPAIETSPGMVAAAEQTAGALVDAYTDPSTGGVVWLSDRLVTSSSSTTISSSGASRATNQDANRTIEITAGTGIGQRASIASNTAEQWTLTDAWAIVPDTTSMFRIVTPSLSVTDDMTVVTALPALVSRTGYLVRINAQGQPFIDYTQPLVANFDVGVPLPSIAAITGGTVYYTDGDREPLAIVPFGERISPRDFPSVTQQGETLHFCGSTLDWNEVASIEVLYAPIAPAFAALTDYFLLPDGARRAVVAQAAAFAGDRVDGMDGIKVNVTALTAKGAAAENEYLGSLRLSKRARRTRFQLAYYDNP